MSGLMSGLVSGVSPHEEAAGPGERREVTDGELAALLAGARVAPSADNAQTWRFVTVRSEATRTELGRHVSPSFAQSVVDASVVIVICGVSWMVTHTRREQPFVMLDVPIATTHMVLRATEMGLPCGWTLDCDESAVRAALGIPAEVRVIAIVAVG
jgi:nitroreductase